MAAMTKVSKNNTIDFGDEEKKEGKNTQQKRRSDPSIDVIDVNA